MKYYAIKFNIQTSDELMQIAKDLLTDCSAEAGCESFEETDNGIIAYAQQEVWDKEEMDLQIESFPLDDTKITYTIEEAEDKDWNQCWEDEGFDPITVDNKIVIYDAKHTTLDERVIRVDVRGMQAEGMCVDITLDMRANDVVDLLVGVVFVGAHVDEHPAFVRDDIVLRTRMNYRERHLRGTEERTHLLKAKIPNPSHVVEGFIDRVDTLVACRMTTLAVAHDVEHHQSFLRDGGLHARRLAHDGHVDMGQQRQDTADAVLSRYLFLGRSQVDEVVGLRAQRHIAKHL